MFYKNISRRKFLDFAKLSIAFLLTSCQNTKKINLGLYVKFFPDTLVSSIPKSWTLNNINLQSDDLKLNLKKNDFILINDGWLNRVNLDKFYDIDPDFIINRIKDQKLI